MRKLFSIALLAVVFLTASAQHVELDYYLPNHASYNKNVPTPESVLGFQVGDFHIQHAQLVTYLKAIEASSDRVKLVNYGYTNERKPLYLAIFSSPENIRNLDKIQAEHHKLTIPTQSSSVDIDSQPVFTWLGHSIHGNEASGLNASVLLIYHLAAANDTETKAWLDNEIIIVDPANNPDGIDRFAEWANQHKSFVPSDDPLNIDHTEAWPGGRYNHYLFDLNRDWLNLQQVESQARQKQILAWTPNVYTCAHEQGSNANYHFSPGEPTRVHPLIPEENQKLIKRLAAEYYVPAFDKRGVLYFSGEQFDDYYIGRGREYFDFHGGLALLWEEQSARGFQQKTDNGLLTFPFAIQNQLTTELATIRGTYHLRKDLLDYQRRYFSNAASEAAKNPVKTYVFGSESDPASSYHLAELIARNGIDVYQLGKEVKANGKTYKPEFSYAVPVSQPRYRLVEGLFEIREKYNDSLSYDITGWTSPYLFNVSYSKQSSAVSLGQKFEIGTTPKGTFNGEKDAYAYLFEWSGYYAPRALYRLLKNDVFAKVSQSVVKFGDKEFQRGTILIPLGNVYQTKSKDEIYQLAKQITEEDGIDVYSVSSGYFEGHNLGSSAFATVRTPKVAIIGGNGTSATGVGEIWHLFDTRYEIPLTIISSERFAAANINAYNVIILTGYNLDFSPAVIKRLKTWVEQGNTLIAYESALQWLKKNEFADIDFIPGKKVKDGAYEDYGVSSRANNIAGVIFGAKLDITHPLGWGYTDENIAVFKNNTINIKPTENKLRTPLQYTKNPVISGNVLKRVAEEYSETPVAVISRLGSGKVIGFSVDTNFRSVWYGTNKLTANAIFWGNLINSRTLE
jgi:hypothetical protein